MDTDLLPQSRLFATLYIVVALLITTVNAITLRVLLKQLGAIIRKYEQNNRLFRRASIIPSFIVATLSSIMITPNLNKSGSSTSLFFPFAKKMKAQQPSSVMAVTSNSGATAFLVSLTIAYLIRGAGMVPLFIIVTFFGDNFGPLKKCDYYLAVTFFNNLTGYCCAYSQLGIAIDRFRAIVTPFKKSFTPNQCRIAIALIWVVSVGAATPAFLILYSRRSLANLINVPGGSRLFCQFTKKEHLLIIALQMTVGCGFPVVACCVLYSTVIARLWSGGMRKSNIGNPSKLSSTFANRPSDIPKSYTTKGLSVSSSTDKRESSLLKASFSEFQPLTFANSNVQVSNGADKANKKLSAVRFAKFQTSPSSPVVQIKKPLSSSSLRRNRNAIKMVIIILILYTLCSIPFYIMTILEIAFKDIKLSYTVEHLHNILIMTDHWLHVAVYLYFNTSFRQGFIDTICGPALMDCAVAILPQSFVGALLRNRRSARGRRSTLDGESQANTHTLLSPKKSSYASQIFFSPKKITGDINLNALAVDRPETSNSIDYNVRSISSCTINPTMNGPGSNNSNHSDILSNDSPNGMDSRTPSYKEKCLTLITNTQTHQL